MPIPKLKNEFVDFNKNNTEYEVYVPYNVEKVNIMGNVEDNSATLSGTGEKQLVVGDNKISLVVTAENGTKKTYIVKMKYKKKIIYFE